MLPGEFSSLDLTDGRVDGDSVGSSYLPSAFVGQPVGVDQVNDVWIGDSGATTHMTRNADMMYDTKSPSPHRSRIILGDGSTRIVEFVGKLDLVFHSRTDHPVTLHDVSFVPDLGFNLFSFHVVQEKHEIILNKTGAHLLNGRLVFLVEFVGKLDLVFHSRTYHPVTLHDVSFVPDLGFNLFSFHVVQEKHEIILNKTGAHLVNGRLVFPRRGNGSSLRATRVMPGAHASANNALATFTDPPSPV